MRAPLSVLPEMRLPAPFAVPPMRTFGVLLMSTPFPPFASATVPFRSVPM